MDYGILSLLPIVITLVIVFRYKNVFLALINGIITASIIIALYTQDYGVGIKALANVFADQAVAMTTFFVLMSGAIMEVAKRSGGIDGLIYYCTQKRKIIRSGLGAQLLTFILGLVLFVDATSSIAVTSMVGKPFFKKYGIAQEKLALIANSTGSAVAWLIPFGGACALLTTFFAPVAANLGIQADPFSIVMQSVGFQFYTLALLAIILLSIVCGWDLGISKTQNSAQKDHEIQFNQEKPTGLARYMLVPIVILVSLVFLILMISGQGNLAVGNGSLAVFSAGILTLLITAIWFHLGKVVNVSTYIIWVIEGMKNMFELVLILALAYAFGSLLTILQAAPYLAHFVYEVPAFLMPCAAFGLATMIAYPTGTSGGTVALLVPILVAIMYPLGVDARIILGAIVSGAVFGDQNSPISDSVILTSKMTEVGIMEHVKTQMPYTFIAWIIAFIGYLSIGIIGG
ncbi:MAG: hypothetical protein MR210_05895 [Erysipelotrichaceae bacterium]|nr:hypothetical protein [Erysipelotrichaceae bacterium]MDY5251280.1 Na+/H+ antiporter NhaC family protein [Erysipelotrichaceae bacterium]